MKTQLIMMAISLIIGIYIGYTIHPDKHCPETTNTLTEIRYITKTDTLIVPRFSTITKRDTIKLRDTTFIYQETNYIAEVDTTYKDSTLTAKVQFVSDIPLSLKSYFNLDFKVRERTITNTIIQTEEVGFFFKRFIPYLGVGISYNGKSIEPAIQLGLGVRLN